MIEGFLRVLRKRAEKSIVRGVVANAMNSKIVRSKKETKKSIEIEYSTIKEKMNNVSVSLGSSVKGKFGEKVRKSIKVQAEKINELH